MKQIALVVGGGNGLGLTIVNHLLTSDYMKVYIVDRVEPNLISDKIVFCKTNLINDDVLSDYEFGDVDTLIYTAGFGRVAHFEDIHEIEIINSFKVNVVAFIKLVKYFYAKIKSDTDFYTAVISSISGKVVSPLFSVYGSTKSALSSFVESVNIELIKSKYDNRILEVSPGQLKGTSFYNETTQLDLNADLSNVILRKMFNRELLYIPNYNETYKDVISSYQNDWVKFGVSSYDYKLSRNRLSSNKQIIVGYLSGTFDLFHIGHLNLLRRAKLYCDYLIVGVHKDAKHKGKTAYIPFNERREILESVKYVDKVIESLPEDDQVYEIYKYDFLFVGSDYKGTDRFNRYEEKFKDGRTKIIYLPYTKETSSTKLREFIDKTTKSD